jgi:hypothetical protein
LSLTCIRSALIMSGNDSAGGDTMTNVHMVSKSINDTIDIDVSLPKSCRFSQRHKIFFTTLSQSLKWSMDGNEKLCP